MRSGCFKSRPAKRFSRSLILRWYRRKRAPLTEGRAVGTEEGLRKTLVFLGEWGK